ncbi:MAG: ATP-grasp domain-containing protein, partial [Erysipelotrichaceae bacterium]|nr:ATP-grasp domain-containing protein [Erysipelotrichaceae bacterium]
AAFCREVGYPVIVKPDNGVGASDTHKIKNDEELKNFIDHKDDTRYIMEEFIDAEVNSYDCIVNSKGEPLFETGNVTPNSLMDIVNNNDNCLLYIRNELPDELREKGRRVLKAFGVRSRFVHFEFFKLNRDQHIGKKDEIVALEVNMRPSGGISPTMMNYANGTDVYKIWADMIAFDSTTKGKANSQYCVFASRRDGKHFDKTPEEIRALYRNNLKEEGRVAEALSGAMADYMFMANFDTIEEVNQFFIDVLSNH